MKALLGFAVVLSLLACRASPLVPDPEPPRVWALAFDPPPDEGLVDRVVHVEIPGVAGEVEVESLWLVEGEATSLQINALARGEPSKAFAERRVAARAFERGEDVVVAPDIVLAPGAHTIVSVSPRWTARFEVREDLRFPVLSRAWPPRDAAAQPTAWLFCGDARVGEPSEVALAPQELLGQFEGWADPRCVRFTGSQLDAGFAVPPPWINCDGTPCSLDPGAIAAGTTAVAPMACAPGEVVVGPGCAQVLDDRLVVRAPSSPLYWFVAIDGGDPRGLFSGATDGGGRFLVRGVTPDATVALLVRTLDPSGAEQIDRVVVQTRSPMPHVVLNEVYANPIGAEPAQEWVELYNDGPESVDLAGLLLRDAGGEVALPDLVVAPGGFVIVASEALERDDGFDEPIPPTCAIARVASLGKNGLGNGGEPLALVTASRETLSRFAPVPASKAGESAIRATPDAFDDDPAAFAATPNVTPCAQNTPAINQGEGPL